VEQSKSMQYRGFITFWLQGIGNIVGLLAVSHAVELEEPGHG